MFDPSLTAGAAFLYLPGLFFLLAGTWLAVRQRHDARRLIYWGALHDAGLLCIALGAATGPAFAGVWLFLLFQAVSRLLALRALGVLAQARGDVSVEALRGAGSTCRKPALLFVFGLMAAVGGTPFLMPEARACITQGVLMAALPFGSASPLVVLLIEAVCATIFIALHVQVLRVVWFEPAPLGAADRDGDGNVGAGFLAGLLAVLVAGMGLLRGPMLDMAASFAGYAAPHAPVHPAFWMLYCGAFVVGLAFWFKVRGAEFLGCVAALLAFSSVINEPHPVAAAELFLVIISLVTLVVAIYSVGYMAHAERKGWYWFFLLLTFASLAGIVSTADMGALHGYWELMTFASYFLVVHENNRTAHDAGFKYYIMCAGGACLMLPGLMLLGGGYSLLAAVPSAAPQLSVWAAQAAILLCFVGFAVKAGLVPFHSWLPDAHPAAPSSVSGPLSGVITKMGIFGIILIIYGQAGSVTEAIEGSIASSFGLNWFGGWLTLLGAATLIFGEVMALRQDDIKRMLAYSTLGQIGEMALVLGMGTWLAATAGLAHTLNHAIMKDLLFLGAGALILRTGSRSLQDMRGLGRQMPWTVSCMAVGLVSIMGLPPFGAFFSKYLMIQAAVQADHIWLGALIFAGSLVGVVYYTRILKTLVFEERPAHLPVVSEVSGSMRIALGLLAFLCLMTGLAPQLPLILVAPVASACFNTLGGELLVFQSVMVPWECYVIVPVFGALLPVFFRKSPVKAGLASVLVLLVTALLVATEGTHLDTLSYCFALIVPLVGALNMIYALGYMSHSHTQWRFYAAFTAMCGGLIGMVSSTYLFSFFLFWEIMSSWTLYLAIAHEGDRDSLREAFKYFFFNVLGAGFIFVGVCVIGPAAPLSAVVALRPDGLLAVLPPWAAWVGMALLAVGFVMKAAQLPFRIDWQMHPALAPTPVSGYISSVLLKSAVIGLIKLFMLIGGGLALARVLGLEEISFITNVVMWIGGITIVMAAIQALLVSNVKLVFIYSTVSQIGYMVLAVAAGGVLGYAGGMLHLVNHVFFKDLLFLVCGAVMFATHKDSLDDLGGIGRKMPFTLCMFAIAGLSVVGVPPTSGFTSKWLIYHALMQAGQPVLALLSLVGSVLTLAYVAKFLHAAFLGQPGEHLDDVKEAPFAMRLPMFILAVGCVLTGVFPGLALSPINAVLAEYGAPTLDVGLSGVLSGVGAWNATAVFVMMALAFAGGCWFLKRFVRLREIDVHMCGLPPQTASSRMNPAGMYAGLERVMRFFPGNEQRRLPAPERDER